MKTYLNENSFLSLVSSAVEVYPNETLGILIGIKSQDKIQVQYAVPYQTAKRSKDEVEVTPLKERRLNKFLTKTTALEIVGDFHSHSEYEVSRDGYKLSLKDKSSMKRGGLGIVIVISKDKKRREWRHLSKGSLLGSIYPYRSRITSWFAEGDQQSKRFSISDIFCPFALGLNR
ncbi:MAG: Mov34/MPN/PAD-1 family protein [Methanobacteriota archaeon]